MKPIIEDPEVDLTRRINKEISSTIANLLSKIVHESISSCLEKTIDFDDEAKW